MAVTLVVSALAALVIALLSVLTDASNTFVPHDLTTLELAAMSAGTLAVYNLAKRRREHHQSSAAVGSASAGSVPARYADALAAAAAEEAAEHAA